MRGPLALATVQQTFVNDGDAPTHGVYRFALPPEAVVDDMVLRIGDQTVRSEVQPKRAARQTYERAREQGDLAALTEQIDLHSPTHPGGARTLTGGHGTAHWASFRSGRDLVLRWQTASAAPQAAVLTDGQHSLLLVEVDDGPATRTAPIDWVVAVDASASMQGAPWEQAKQLTHALLDRVRLDDTVALTVFGDTPRQAPAGRGTSGVHAARALLAQTEPDGTTKLALALRSVLTATGSPDRRRLVVLISDGLVQTDQGSLDLMARAPAGTEVAVLGVGQAPNRGLLQALAAAGVGRSAFPLPDDDPEQVLARLSAAIARPACSDVVVEWHVPIEAWPQDVPDLLVGQPLVAMARHDRAPPAVDVSCQQGERPWSTHLVPQRIDDARALTAAFAGGRVEELLVRELRTGQPAAPEGEAIALEAGIISPWTSRVAVLEQANTPARQALWSERERGEADALSRDELSPIPSGRSYQYAVIEAAGSGGNPNMAGGAYNESTYMLDGVNVADPVTGTFSLNFKYRETDASPFHQRLHPITRTYSSHAFANTTSLGLAAGNLSRGFHARTGGPVRRDRLWAGAELGGLQLGNVELGERRLAIGTMFSATHMARVDVGETTVVVPNNLVHQQQIGAQYLYFDEPLQWQARVDHQRGHDEQGRTRRATTADAYVQFGDELNSVHGGAEAQAIALHDVYYNAGQASGFAHVRRKRLHATLQLGAATGRTWAPLGSLALSASSEDDAQAVGLRLEQQVPDLRLMPSGRANLPVRRTLTLAGETALPGKLALRGELATGRFQSWAHPGAAFVVLGSTELQTQRGTLGYVELERDASDRFLARLRWTASTLRTDDPLDRHLVDWNDRLRPHRIDFIVKWDLPVFPDTPHLSGGLSWLSSLPDVSAPWARERLALNLHAEQDIYVGIGAVTVLAGVERGVGNGLMSSLGTVLPYSRLDDDVLESTRWSVGLRYVW